MDPDLHHKALPRGDQLHWYRIESILGQGGFGITYLAEDTNLDQRVAIKEYLPNDLAVRVDDTTVQPISEDHTRMYRWGLDRFLMEAKTLARFKHPNIVRVQSFFERNNTAYMVMEYEEGESLASVIKSGRLRNERALMALLEPILDGLELVHREGFIHRDIKPDNIFIRADASPVLLDFGSARHAISGQTHTLTSLVTPGYAPFEQYHDSEGKQGPWTDIYALGATIYRAIAGKTPIEAIKRGMARINHATDPYLPLADLKAGEYSEHFLEAIDCALRFREPDRPQSADSWQRMLQGSEPVPAESEMPGIARQAPPTGGDTQPQTVPDFDPAGAPDTLAPTTPAPATAPTVRIGPPGAAPPRRRAGLVWGTVAAGALVVALAVGVVPRLLDPPSPPPSAGTTGTEAQRAALLQRAERDLADGRADAALGAYRELLQLDAADQDALRGIDGLVQSGLAAAHRELEAGRAQRALAGFERVLQAQPAHTAALQGRQQAQAALARAREQAAVVARHQRLDQLLTEAGAALQARQFERADAGFREALVLEPDNPAATRALAEIGRMRAADARARTIATLLAEAKDHADAGRLDGARAKYAEVLTLDADNRTATNSLAKIRRDPASRQSPPAPGKTAPATAARYKVAILPWSLRGTENYEATIFAGLEQALAQRARVLELSHSYYREFDAGRASVQPGSDADLAGVWVQKGLFAEAELNERASRTIAGRLGADAVLLASISVAAENASIEIRWLDRHSGRTRRAEGRLHLPIWGYDPQSAQTIRDLFLQVLPARI